MDETGFGKGVASNVCTGNKNTYTRQVVTTQHTTATMCVSASGQVLPTFVIFEKSFPSGAYRDGRVSDATNIEQDQDLICQVCMVQEKTTLDTQTLFWAKLTVTRPITRRIYPLVYLGRYGSLK